MRLILTTFLALFMAMTLSAQNNSGEIVYLEKINIHKNLPPEMEAMKLSLIHI